MSALNLDELLDHSSKPKPIKKKEAKKAAKALLKPYRPKPMPPDPTPDAVVLFWRKTTCTCGEVYEGPRFTKGGAFYRVKLPVRAGYLEKWDYIPKFMPDQYPDIPHILDIDETQITACVKCHGKKAHNPHQVEMDLEPHPSSPFYEKLLHPENFETPHLYRSSGWDGKMTPWKDFVEDLDAICKGACTLGEEVATEMAKHITLALKGVANEQRR